MPIQAAATPAPFVRAPTLQERVDELSVYAESGDAVAEGEIWYVPETAQIFGEDGFTFADVLDIINPLHHLPVVGTLYRAATGDELAPGSRILGGALFGGVIGFVAGLVNAVIEDETGSDLGEKAIALIQGQNDAAPQARAGDPTAAVRAGLADGARRVAAKADKDPAGMTAGAGIAAPIAAPPATTRGGMAGIAQTMTAAQATPAEALIRARVAVPPSGKIPLAGIPSNTRSAASPSPLRPVAAAQESQPAQSPKPEATRHAGTDIRAPRTQAAAKTVRAAAQPAAAPPAKTPAALATDASVPALMRDALNKYEKLMRVRHRPTLADDI